MLVILTQFFCKNISWCRKWQGCILVYKLDKERTLCMLGQAEGDNKCTVEHFCIPFAH